MDEVTVLISSCDGYRSVWEPFCHGLRKYWPDCPWPVRFVTNYLDAPCGGSLMVGEDSDWTAMQRRALGWVSSEVILFMLDDFWLTGPVDTKSLVEFADLIMDKKVDRIHLTNFGDEKRTPCKSNIDRRLNGYTKGSRYRTSLQAGLWRVDTFLSLMRDGESPWDFETKGSVRSQDSSFMFLNVKEHLYIPYIKRPGACEQGEWTKLAREYAARERLKINFSKGPRQ